MVDDVEYAARLLDDGAEPVLDPTMPNQRAHVLNGAEWHERDSGRCPRSSVARTRAHTRDHVRVF
jgi:hypothetical protein